MDTLANFIPLDPLTILYLFVVGFIGGLVSGFIGSGGAFVLTPAMMSLGVPGIVAVASNICHKFPKALVGAIKRAKYGQVDVKLGLVLGVSAEAGVLYGAHVQEDIKVAFGDAGSNLYVSVAFVIVLAIVGGYVLWDALKVYRAGTEDHEEIVSKLARKVQSINIPGTMVYFDCLKSKVSILFTIPLGFATGMLAATIAVGGFIGVPGMHYILGAPSLMASATELVIAFVMGVGGTIKYAWSGLVDIRLAMIILAGSLFGIQLGAIGTTYVKPYMIKVVMGSIMTLVLVSRAIVIPVYLSDLNLIATLAPATAKLLKNVSFTIMMMALATGAFIILKALIKGMRAHRQDRVAEGAMDAVYAPELAEEGDRLDPFGRLERILLVTDGSPYSVGATREAIRLAQRCGSRLRILSVIPSNVELETIGVALLKKEQDDALAHLERVREQAETAGVECDVRLRQGEEIYREIVKEAEKQRVDAIVMGRRGKSGMMRTMLGSTTARVIGHTACSVLVVPRAAHIEGKTILVAVDGSRHSDTAAAAAGNLARQCKVPMVAVSVTNEDTAPTRQREAEAVLSRVTRLLAKSGVSIQGKMLRGRPELAIVEAARSEGSDLIVMGSHGRTGLERVLMGSVSERVIGHAECAVLVVKS
ncbi:putative membrane transporter protein [Gammaproteobacteria bacterium]